MDAYNYAIHNLSEEDLRGQPQFDQVWPFIRDYIGQSCLVAHNASFDMSVLIHTLSDYNIPCPDLTYHCTRIVAKASWQGLPGYGLDIVAAHLNLPFKHHDAEEDAVACAAVMISAAVKHQATSMHDLCERTGTTLGRTLAGGRPRVSSLKTSCAPNASSAVNQPAKNADFDEDHPLFGKSVVFTGTLQSMPRQVAAQLVERCGGTWGESLNKSTAFLILGLQDYRRLKGGDRSTKMLKAEKLVAQGFPIEVISEDEFIRLL